MPDPDADDAPVLIRSASRADRDVLLAWRNDPTAYRYYEHPHPVSPDDHDRWLDARLRQDSPTLWIAWQGGMPLGSVRLDLDDAGSAVVSIVVGEGHRGRGTGAALLAWAQRAAAELSVHTLIATIRPQNATSRRLFEMAGYHELGLDDTGLLRFELAIPAV